MAETIAVEVVYALPRRHWSIALRLPPGSTVGDAIAQSGVVEKVPGIEVSDRRVGIFGKPCGLDAALSDGDRVEIYRPLLCDPKDVRRRRAAGKL